MEISEDVVFIPDLNLDQEYEETFKSICLTVQAQYPDSISIAPKLLGKIEKMYANHDTDKREEYEYCLEAARQILALEMTAFSGLIGAP